MPRKSSARPHRRPTPPPRHAPAWLAIRVELIEGRGESLTSPAGRLFAASPEHTFAMLARQIDIAFARWDLSHLHEFELADGTRIGPLDEDADEDLLDGEVEVLGRVGPKDAFTYTFDLGDTWLHRCSVEEFIDPLEVLGVVPKVPTAFFGWGTIPDQYGRLKADE